MIWTYRETKGIIVKSEGEKKGKTKVDNDGVKNDLSGWCLTEHAGM